MAIARFGLRIPAFPTDGSKGSAFIDQLMRYMDRLRGSFEVAWVEDHFLPWVKLEQPSADTLECWSTISYLAGAFPSYSFGSVVLGNSYRQPSLVAKMVATLQQLTGGRVILGIGAGWKEDEYLAYGYPFPRPAVRVEQLAESLQIIRALWTQERATFHGRYFRVEGALCEPKPDPIPPIMVGGSGEQLLLRVVARYADWWNMPGGEPEAFAHKLGALKRHCEEVGRDFDSLVKTWTAGVVAIAETEDEARGQAEASPFRHRGYIAGTPEQVAEQLRRYVDLGCQHLILRFADFPSTAGAELFAREVIPRLRAPADE